MKRLVLIWLWLVPLLAVGQNFSTVVADSVHYFKSQSGTLVGLRVDSVVQLNQNSEFYFHREFRWRHHGSTAGCDSVQLDEHTAPVDLYGPSWIGLKCVRFADSSEVYFNYQNDSIDIRPTASLGDTWKVFREEDGNIIQAEIVEVMADTVDGQLQSVKVMELQHLDSNGVTINGYWNGVQWQLSELSGWKRVHSLYMFPSFAPIVYQPWESDWADLKSLEMRDSSLFELLNDPIPTMGEMFDYSVGSHYQTTSSNFVNNGGFPELNTYYDHWYVLTRQDFQDSIRYVIDGNEWMLYDRNKRFPNDFLPFQYYYGPRFGQIDFTDFGLAIVGQPVVDSLYSTEIFTECELVGWSMNFLTMVEYPIQGDSLCSYALDCPPIGIAFFNHLVGYTTLNGCFESSSSLRVNYAQTEWCSFGQILHAGIDERYLMDIDVYPNPTTSTLRIQLPDGNLSASQTRLYDMTGRLVLQQPFNPVVDVSALQTGSYILVVETELGRFRNVIQKE